VDSALLVARNWSWLQYGIQNHSVPSARV